MRQIGSVLITCALALFLCGCIAVPLPHVTCRSPRVSGRVLDARGEPVDGAVVQIIANKGTRRGTTYDDDLPGASTRTDKSGRFLLRARYNFHLLWYATASWDVHVPFGTYWSGVLLISEGGHDASRVRLLDYWSGERSVTVGDIQVTNVEHQLLK